MSFHLFPVCKDVCNEAYSGILIRCNDI